MSLTNQMLKNLKSRHVQSTKGSDMTADLSPAQMVNKSSTHRLTILYFLFTVGLLACLVEFMFLNTTNANPTTAEAITTSSATNPITTVKTQPVKQAESSSTTNVQAESEAIPFDMIKQSTDDNDKLLKLPELSVDDMSAASDKLQVKTEVKPSLEEKIDQAYEYALSLVAENKIKDAVEILQNILQTEPENETVRNTLATLLLQQGDNTEAMRALAAGLELQPNNVPLTTLYARAQMNQDQYEQALQTLLKISNKASDDSNYNALLASVYQHLGKSADAVAVYQRLLAQEPYNARWLVGLGISLEQMGDNNSALQAYQKAKSSNQLPPDLLSFVISRIRALGGMN